MLNTRHNTRFDLSEAADWTGGSACPSGRRSQCFQRSFRDIGKQVWRRADRVGARMEDNCCSHSRSHSPSPPRRDSWIPRNRSFASLKHTGARFLCVWARFSPREEAENIPFVARSATTLGSSVQRRARSQQSAVGRSAGSAEAKVCRQSGALTLAAEGEGERPSSGRAGWWSSDPPRMPIIKLTSSVPAGAGVQK